MDKYVRLTETSKTGMCVEIGSLIFAILNVIVTSISTAVASVYIFYIAVVCALYGSNDVVGVILVIFVSAWIAAALTFAFSIILLIGLNQKKPGYVKAYFAYGVATVLVCFAVVLAFFFGPRDYYSESDSFIIGISLMSSCTVYSAILTMIWARYKKLREEDRYERLGLEQTRY